MSDCVFLQLASRALKCVMCNHILFVIQSCSSKFCGASFIHLTSSVVQTTKHFYVLFFGMGTHYLILSYSVAPLMPKNTAPTDKVKVIIGLKVCGRRR